MNDHSLVTRWWLVRHAPVAGLPAGALVGQKDVSADVSDPARFAALAQRLPNSPRWVVTGLKRTRQTLDALIAAKPERDAERIEVDLENAFLEQNFGAWTGLTWDEIGALPGTRVEDFWAAPATTRPPPGGDFHGESFRDVCLRVGSRMDQLNIAWAGRDIVCVAHAGSIRAALAHGLGLTPDQALAVVVDNTALARLDYLSHPSTAPGSGSWRVVGLNMIW